MWWLVSLFFGLVLTLFVKFGDLSIFRGQFFVQLFDFGLESCDFVVFALDCYFYIFRRLLLDLFKLRLCQDHSCCLLFQLIFSLFC